MTAKPDLRGTFLTACFQGTSAPPRMEDGTLFKAAPATTGGEMRVVGTAVVFGITGWFWGGAIRIAKNAVDMNIADRKRKSQTRDVLGLGFHDAALPLARQANNTLDMRVLTDRVEYEMRLNPASQTAQDIYAMLLRGDVTAASIGFSIEDGDWVEGEDNSLETEIVAEEDDIDIYEATAITIHEISLVAQGALGGATSRPVAGAVPLASQATAPAVGEVATDVVTGTDLTAMSETDGIVADNDTEPDASADQPEGHPGDDPGGGGTADDRPQSDDDGQQPDPGFNREEVEAWAADQKRRMRERRIEQAREAD